jgi:hypothetical protein
MTGSFNYNASQNPAYTWNCQGSDGAVNQCYAFAVATTYGQCGGYDYSNNYYSDLDTLYAANPNDPGFCSTGTVVPGSLTSDPGAADPQWGWECEGTGAGGIGSGYTWCNANESGGSTAVCGTAQGSQNNATAPSGSAALCSSGTPGQAPYENSPANTEWLWSCIDSNNNAVNCYAYTPLSNANGACGDDENQPTDHGPSQTVNNDMCTSGTPNPNPAQLNTAGTEWLWTCEGAGTGTPQSCQAPVCQTCSGTIPRTVTVQRPATVIGTCTVTATTTWTETDTLTNQGQAASTGISWQDAMGNFNYSITSEPEMPTYCPPGCYTSNPQVNVSSIQTIVSAVSPANCSAYQPGSSIPPSNVVVQ